MNQHLSKNEGDKPTQQRLDMERAEGEGMATMHPVSAPNSGLSALWMRVMEFSKGRPGVGLCAAAGFGLIAGLLAGRLLAGRFGDGRPA